MKALTRVRRRATKLRIWTSKIMPNLWLLDLFSPINKKKFHTPPYCTVGYLRIHISTGGDLIKQANKHVGQEITNEKLFQKITVCPLN